jgi:hypothetical protein
MPEAPKTKKSLDQIVSDTLNSNFGISNDDLAALFEDDAALAAPAPTSEAVTPPIEAATPPAPAVAPAAPAPAAEPTPNPPEPQKVESAPVQSKEWEKDFASTKEQLAGLTTLVQELVRRTQIKPESTKADNRPNPLDEITDQDIMERPKESVVKAMRAVLGEVLPKAFQEYDTATTARQTIGQFAAQHSDFNELRPIMRQIVSEDPANNDNMAALPRVYEEAKRRKVAALAAMRKELAIPEAPVNTETPTPAPATPQLSEEELMNKLEQRLAEKIRKRRAASGALTNDQTAPVSPGERQNTPIREKPLTDDEKLFDDMLKSGPPSTQFLRGLDLVSKK